MSADKAKVFSDLGVEILVWTEYTCLVNDHFLNMFKTRISVLETPELVKADEKIIFVFPLSEAGGMRVQKGVHSSRVGGIDG